MTMNNTEQIKLGASSCLLGEQVRYDGGHKRNRYLTDTLSNYFQFVPVCPEVECGMPVPREALRLVGDPNNPSLVTIRTQKDYTEQMQRWGKEKLEELAEQDLCGYIFKSASPSSGMERIKVYNHKGNPTPTGVGIWARMFMEHFPYLPVEDEGRLNDPKLREQFVEHVFVYSRWRRMIKNGGTPGLVVDFHSRHKMLLMAHNRELYDEMGKLTANAGKMEPEQLRAEYFQLLDKAVREKTTVNKNVNVLQHLIGYFKQELTSDEKQEFLEILDNYHQGNLPLIVPVTLINHFVRKYNQPYLQYQYYLNPHPIELKLRNQA